MTNKKCKRCSAPATVLDYCRLCWEKYEPTEEELNTVMSQQAIQLPKWWKCEEQKVNEQEDR